MKYRFGDIEFNDEGGLILSGDHRVRLKKQEQDLLKMLIEQKGQIVSREEIRLRLWPDRKVEFDHSLDVTMSRLRWALRDNHARPRFVETIPKKGYRFVGEVRTNGSNFSTYLKQGALYVSIFLFLILGVVLFVHTRYERFVHPSNAIHVMKP